MFLARLGTPAPIRYVQDAILNLRHPYIGVATATPDDHMALDKYLKVDTASFSVPSTPCD